MGLNKVSKRGNMYKFITHTWNTVKGSCMHDCSYCYMKRWGKLNPTRFDEKELKTDLGENNFLFVGSSNDLFANNIPTEWIEKTFDYCSKYNSNRYMFQTKNPTRIVNDRRIRNKLYLLKNTIITTTLESNRFYSEIMHEAPKPQDRADAMNYLSQYFETFVTIEPIMDFDLGEFVKILKKCNPSQINIGADTGINDLPEPSKEKVKQLIDEINGFTTIHNKSNLKRML